MEHANPGIGHALDMHAPAHLNTQIKRLEQGLVQLCYVGMRGSIISLQSIEKWFVS